MVKTAMKLQQLYTSPIFNCLQAAGRIFYRKNIYKSLQTGIYDRECEDSGHRWSAMTRTPVDSELNITRSAIV